MLFTINLSYIVLYILIRLRIALFSIILFAQGYFVNAQKYSNHLRNESSPYLKQHSQNPVDWYPWRQEVLDLAKQRNKLLIVSIGYASCHWCHVMERETFNDTAVSSIMNKHFLSIKVDREERPDIDQIYLSACRLMNGAECGWPLNAIALPDGRPVYIGTYQSKEKWKETINYFADQYRTAPLNMLSFAEGLAKGMKPAVAIYRDVQEIHDSIPHMMYASIMNSLDLIKGGKKGSPKFPMHSLYRFLLAYGNQYKIQKATDIALGYLTRLATSGMHDLLHGGFSRYSLDEDWRVPHFEKMLYDNAQLLSLFSFAYQITKERKYLSAIQSIHDFVSKNLKNKEGGYFSSMDADSDNEEGKYYLWTKGEIDEAVHDENLADSCLSWFDLREEGNAFNASNYELLGKNVLSLNPSIPDHVLQSATWAEIKKRLILAKSGRTHPNVDNKIITSWNALMVKAYVDSYMATRQDDFKSTAIQIGEWLWDNQWNSGTGLKRVYSKAKPYVAGCLDDYANLGDAYIKLYQITFNMKWLYRANLIKNKALRNFTLNENNLFDYSTDSRINSISKTQEIYDQALPSSNAIFANLLFSLSTYMDNEEDAALAKKMILSTLFSIPPGSATEYGQWLSNTLWLTGAPYEIGIVGMNYNTILNEMISHYIPNGLWFGTRKKENIPLLQGKYIKGTTTIYVCQNKVCLLPVYESAEALKLIK